MKRTLATACALLTLGMSACTSSSGGEATNPAADEPGDPGYVGDVDGTDALIAVSIGGGEVFVYVCDGEADIAEWFTGPADADGNFDLTNQGGTPVVGELNGDRFTGQVTLSDGKPHNFVAAPAASAGALFRISGTAAEQAGVVGGWIVDSSGKQRGSLRVNGKRQAASALPAGNLVVAGARYPVVVYFVPTRLGIDPPSAPSPLPIPYPTTNGPVVAPGT